MMTMSVANTLKQLGIPEQQTLSLKKRWITKRCMSILLFGLFLFVAMWSEEGSLEQYRKQSLRHHEYDGTEPNPTPITQMLRHHDLTLSTLLDPGSFAAQFFPECFASNVLIPWATLNQPPWSDIDWRGDKGNNKGSCGWIKCFYPSISNPLSVGYLVARTALPSSGSETQFANMKRATRLGKTLLERGVNALALPNDPPLLMNLSFAMACLIADRVHQPATALPLRKIHVYPNATLPQVVVQRVPRAPTPHLVIGTSTRKMKHLSLQWALFANLHVRNLTAFREQFAAQMKLANDVLEKHGNLCNDFQVIVDGEGNVYHLDLDRAFVVSWNKRTKESMCREVKEKLQKQLDIMMNASISINHAKRSD